MSSNNGTGFDHANIERVLECASLPERAPAFAEGAKHMPCVECAIGTWWYDCLPKGAIFRCDCGTMLCVESAPDDVVVHVIDASDPVVTEAPPARPTAPGIEELLASGARRRAWADEARARLRRLMKRLVRTGGSEEDAAAICEAEAQHWREKFERRKQRERVAVNGAKP